MTIVPCTIYPDAVFDRGPKGVLRLNRTLMEKAKASWLRADEPVTLAVDAETVVINQGGKLRLSKNGRGLSLNNIHLKRLIKSGRYELTENEGSQLTLKWTGTS